MKLLHYSVAVLFLVLLFGVNTNAQSTCTGGKIDGVYHTSCYPWLSGDGTLSIPNFWGGSNVTVNNDTPRLQRALSAAFGKIIFDEADYFINDELIIFSYRLITGTGRSGYLGTISPGSPNHPTSKIVQTANNKAVFKIGMQVYDVSIRDLTFVGGYGTTGTIGILAEGSQGSGYSSVSFQFSNLKFARLDKGIYVNATNSGEWQFDNVRLDHSTFEWCNTGLYINSYNSGWNISSIQFMVPEGVAHTAGSGQKTYGVYLERSTYTNMSMLIGGGPFEGTATMFIYVKEHANLTIQNSQAERFKEDINIDGDSVSGTGRNFPILLMNNVFISSTSGSPPIGGVTIKDSTVISMGNQFGFGTADIRAVAKGTSKIYSIGDKFCFEGASCETDKGYTLEDSAQLVFGTNKYKTEVDTLKLGTRTFSTLGTPGNGTLYYCSDCQAASTCTGSGSGALAKRINGAWVCN